MILFALYERIQLSEFDAGVNVVLDEAPERTAISWHDELLVGRSDDVGLGSGEVTLWEVAIHFVTVVISVVGVAVYISTR